MIIRRFLGKHYAKLELGVLIGCVVAATYVRSISPGWLSELAVLMFGIVLLFEMFALGGGHGLLARRVYKGEQYYKEGYGTITITEGFWAPVWSPVLKAVNRYHNYS